MYYSITVANEQYDMKILGGKLLFLISIDLMEFSPRSGVLCLILYKSYLAMSGALAH